MGAWSYKELKSHIGHNVVVVAYGEADDPANVAVECEDCGEVLFDYDKPRVSKSPKKNVQMGQG